MKLYVAYGSNLNVAQMAYRCPTARMVSSAVIPNWELLYKGTRRAGVATIMYKKGVTLPVGLWEIDDEAEAALDIYEGYPHLYGKQNIFVTLPDGKRKLAMVYIMNNGHKTCYPSDSYINTIMQGYDDFGLDIDFFYESLEKCSQMLRKK